MLGFALGNLFRFLGMIPLRWHGPIACTLGRLAALLPLRESRIAELQMQHFLGQNRLPLSNLYSHFARVLLESAALSRILNTKKFSCDNMVDIQKWITDQRPLIALTAHLGNWDLLAAWFIAKGIPITTIGRVARHSAVQELLQNMRNSYGVKTLWRGVESGERTILRELLADMKARRVIAALLDQDTRVDSALVPFFGMNAKTPNSLVEMGLRRQARFVSAFLVREQSGDYVIQVRDLSEGKTAYEILLAYHQHLEQMIRRYPNQWVWFHKRWRTLDSGETLSSTQYLNHLEGLLREKRPQA